LEEEYDDSRYEDEIIIVALEQGQRDEHEHDNKRFKGSTMALKIQHNFGQAYVHAYYRRCEER
jgi:hypothetical protein